MIIIEKYDSVFGKLEFEELWFEKTIIIFMEKEYDIILDIDS